MKKFILFSAVAASLIILACNKQTILSPVKTTTIFSAASKMKHAKDTLSAAGDTIWLTANGNISDSSKKYSISANLKTADSVNRTITTAWLRTVPVTFGVDTAGKITWTATLALPFPAIPAKNKLTTTAVFSYGLNTSSQFGNTSSVDSKFTYVK
jgi:hypothetical protein